MMDPAYMENWAQTQARFAAWWRNEVLDRPVTVLSVPRATPRTALRSLPPTETVERLMLDPQYAVDWMENLLAATDFLGDAIPQAGRGLGVGTLGSLAGAEPHFSKGSVWINPCVTDWAAVPLPRFDADSPISRRMLAVADAIRDNARGRYLLSTPDLLDAATTMSQMQLTQDLIFSLSDDPGPAKAYQKALVQVWLDAYDFWREYDRAAGQEGSINWTSTYSPGRGGVVQCDFSALLSPPLFRDFALPEITATADHLDYAVFHVDGREEEKFLDDLFAVRSLRAFQWVYGTTSPSPSKYPDTIRRIQAAGRPVEVTCFADELPVLFGLLKPRGLMLRLMPPAGHTLTREEGLSILRDIERWTASCRT